MRIRDYYTPENLTETFALLEEHAGSARLISGGTDVIVRAKKGFVQDATLIDISKLEELQGISVVNHTTLRIGGGVKLSEIYNSSLVQEKAPIVSESAGWVGSVQIRNMGTMGGNVCNASPSADTSPPLLVLDTQVVVTGPEGERKIPLKDFFVGPGKTVMQPTEVLKEFLIPFAEKNAGLAYIKHSRRVVMDLATVNCAIKLLLDPDSKNILEAAVCLGAVAPTPVLLPEIAEQLKGTKADSEVCLKASCLAANRVSPIKDVRASKEYREEMVGVLVKNTLRKAYENALTKTR